MLTNRFPLRCVTIFLIVLVFCLSGCTGFKKSVYEMAMDHERGKAGLVPKTVSVNGRSIAFLESEDPAERPVVVLVHGFAANKENWIRFAAALKGAFHVIALDLPGHGESVKDFSLRYDIDDQVGYLHAFVAQLGITSFHLAGNSMGGAISSLYAATYPGQIRSLVLFNPGGIYDHESMLHQYLREGKNPLIVQSTDDFDKLMDFALEKKPFIPWPITSVLAERAIANKPMNDKIFKDIKGEHRYVFKEAIRTIQAPTLILWGRKDRIINVKNADIFQKLIPDARKIIFEDIGHAPMIEIPEETAQICRDFFSGK